MVCRVRLPVTDSLCLQASSDAHPEDQILVEDWSHANGRGLIVELRILGPNSRAWIEELRAHPGVDEVEPFELERDSVRLFATIRDRERSFIPLLEAHRVLRRRPFRVSGGEQHWTLIGKDRQIRDFLAAVRARAPSSAIVSLRPWGAAPSSPLLTPRQRHLYEAARKAGYFDVPARVRLADLARQLRLSKSTLSSALAMIECRLLASAESAEIPAA